MPVQAEQHNLQQSLPKSIPKIDYGILGMTFISMVPYPVKTYLKILFDRTMYNLYKEQTHNAAKDKEFDMHFGSKVPPLASILGR